MEHAKIKKVWFLAVIPAMHVLLIFHAGQGFFTHDLALRLESGGYRVTGRLNNAIRIQGLWLDVASIEDQMVLFSGWNNSMTVAGCCKHRRSNGVVFRVE